MKTLTKNGRIVTAVDDYHADFLLSFIVFLKLC